MVARFRTSSTAILFLVFSFAYAQTTDEEFTILRDHLNLPASTPIKFTRSSALTSDFPIKTYIATGLDKDVHKNFVRWIEEWNAKDGKEYGSIEIVPELSQADVILTRCRPFEDLHSKTLVFGRRQEPLNGREPGRLGAVGFSGLYVYIVERKSDGLNILQRYIQSYDGTEANTKGKDTWEDFRRLVKRRGENKEKQKVNSND